MRIIELKKLEVFANLTYLAFNKSSTENEMLENWYFLRIQISVAVEMHVMFTCPIKIKQQKRQNITFFFIISFPDEALRKAKYFSFINVPYFDVILSDKQTQTYRHIYSSHRAH